MKLSEFLSTCYDDTMNVQVNNMRNEEQFYGSAATVESIYPADTDIKLWLIDDDYDIRIFI